MRRSILVAFLLAGAWPVRAIDFFGIDAGGTAVEAPGQAAPKTPSASGSMPALANTGIDTAVGQADSFGGIPWGSSEDAVRAIVAGWGDLKLQGRVPGVSLSYTGGTFAGRPIKRWELQFAKGRLYRGAVHLVKQGQEEEQFEEIKGVLTSKYGPRTRMERANGFEILEWKLRATPPSKEEKRVRCTVHPDGHQVILAYVNDTIRTSVGKPE